MGAEDLRPQCAARREESVGQPGEPTPEDRQDAAEERKGTGGVSAAERGDSCK